jgi:elongation factor 2
VCFEIVDAKIHHDSAHRRADQICPAMRRACFAAILTALPRFLEPVFSVDISVPDFCLNAVCKSLKKRRGEILEDQILEGTPLHAMRAHLPVASSFGFSTELRSETSGRAFPQCSFSHWQVIDDDPLDECSRAAAIVTETRARKRMNGSTVPALSNFLDTL